MKDQKEKLKEAFRPPKSPVEGFSEALDRMDREAKKVDWEGVAKRQETELSYAHAYNEKLVDKIKEQEIRINKFLAIIDYLENKLENSTI
jgi:hypothetical protein